MKESRFAKEMRQEGRQEGRIEELRIDFLKVIRQRFGDAVASELASDVNALEDLELLERLFDQALSGADLDTIRAALPVSTD